MSLNIQLCRLTQVNQYETMSGISLLWLSGVIQTLHMATIPRVVLGVASKVVWLSPGNNV